MIIRPGIRAACIIRVKIQFAFIQKDCIKALLPEGLVEICVQLAGEFWHASAKIAENFIKRHLVGESLFSNKKGIGIVKWNIDITLK